MLRIILCSVLMVLVLPVFTFSQDAMEILKKTDEIRAANHWGFNLEIIEYQGAKVLSSNRYVVTARTFGEFPNALYKSAIFAQYPKDVEGQKTLKDGQIYWQFFPATKNLVRISGAQKMAGQVNASDVASSNFANDYSPKLLGQEECLKQQCYKLELNQLNEQVTYNRLLLWVNKENYRPIKVEYFAVSDKHLKTSYYREFKPAMGIVKPHELWIVDPLKEGCVTRMVYRNIHEEKMPDYYFTKDTLKDLKAPEVKVAEAEKLDATTIMQKADEKRCGDNWKFNITIHEFQPTPESKRAKLISSDEYLSRTRMFGTESKCYTEFLAPKAVEGQKMLREGRVYWMFFPGTKNIVRISATQRLSGQATAADIASTNFEHDYTAELEGEEPVHKSLCYKLILKAKDETVAYAKLIYWVQKDNFNPLKVEYYSLSDKLLKTGYYRDFKKIQGDAVKAHELFIVDPIVKDHVTRMLYSNIVAEEAPEYLFRKESLK